MFEPGGDSARTGDEQSLNSTFLPIFSAIRSRMHGFGCRNWSKPGRRNSNGTQDTIERSVFWSRLTDLRCYSFISNRLGNVIGNLGKPGGLLRPGVPPSIYRYVPFHRFEFAHSDIVAEPLVFLREVDEGNVLFINPDLWLALELEEKYPGKEWWELRAS